MAGPRPKTPPAWLLHQLLQRQIDAALAAQGPGASVSSTRYAAAHTRPTALRQAADVLPGPVRLPTTPSAPVPLPLAPASSTGVDTTPRIPAQPTHIDVARALGFNPSRHADLTVGDRLSHLGEAALAASAFLVPGEGEAELAGQGMREAFRPLSKLAEAERNVPAFSRLGGTRIDQMLARSGVLDDAARAHAARINDEIAALQRLPKPQQGPSPYMAERLMEHTRAHGGATFTPAGEAFAGRGFAVADPAFTKTVSHAGEMADWLADPKLVDRLSRPGAHIGTWYNPRTGLTEINVSDILPTRADAETLGRARQQDAIGHFEVPGAYQGDISLAQPQRLAPPARGPNADVQQLVQGYRQKSGIRDVMPRATAVDPNAGRRMANVFEALQSAPNDEAVRAAYDQFNREVEQQYQHALDAGYQFEFTPHDPYANSAEMMQDVRQNRRLKVFKTSADQTHSYLTPEQNDRFRAVHDLFGHAAEGNQFGPLGEENAYRAHASMFSPQARDVMATETRGQNSWLNYFGNHQDLALKDRPFAQQKAALWPRELQGDYGDFPSEAPTAADILSAHNAGTLHPAFRGQGQTVFGTSHLDAMEKARALGLDVGQMDHGWHIEGTSHFMPDEQVMDAFPKFEDEPVAPTSPTRLPWSGVRTRGKGGALSAEAQAVTQHLRPDEAAMLQSPSVAQDFQKAHDALPDVHTFAQGALAGAAKRGWYANSAQSLRQVFGEDAPRFAGVLASLSPQTPVDRNLTTALQFWRDWTAAGRPTDAASVKHIIRRYGSLGSSWENNLVRVVGSEDPLNMALSGPKVTSFMRNNMNDADAVTLDTWMSKLANINPRHFDGRPLKVAGDELRVPSGSYLAYSGRLRQTARHLTELTGEHWTPAEVQETLWSWGKGVTEGSDVAQVPDFSTLMQHPENAQLLQEARLQQPTVPPHAAKPSPVAPDENALETLRTNMERHSRGDFAYQLAPFLLGGGLLGSLRQEQ